MKYMNSPSAAITIYARMLDSILDICIITWKGKRLQLFLLLQKHYNMFLLNILVVEFIKNYNNTNYFCSSLGTAAKLFLSLADLEFRQYQ